MISLQLDPFLRWLIAAPMLVMLIAASGVQESVASPKAQPTSAFQPAPCMFDLPIGAVEGQDIECGYVTVPEQHINPQGRTIQLAVAIVKSTSPSPVSDPLFMAQGGPGGSTIDAFVQPLMDSPFRDNRDIVLFDQRGTLYSKPALTCPEIFDLTIETIEQDLSPEESERLYEEASAACHNRLVDEGINLSAFNSLENAADIAALRVALGYNEINLYGVSYGTLLALHTMRDSAAGLRSVILDAVAPPQINFQVEAPQSEERAFTALFNACATDADCNKAYPDLERVFYDLIAQLNETPTRVRVTDPETGKSYNAVMDGDGLEGSIFQMLYATDLIPALPKMIYDAREGNYNVMGRFLSILIFDRTISEGMYYSVFCAEDADFNLQDVDLTEVHPQIAETSERGLEGLLRVCQQWNVVPLGPSVDAPIVSSIPTLLLSGAFDPITPPAFAEATAQTLERSYAYTFPNTGHGAIFTGACSDGIIQAFLNNPTVTPDASCIAEQSGPVFITPDTVLMVPAIGNLLTLEGNAGSEIFLFGVCMFILLAAMIIWPLAWFIGLFLSRPKRPQSAASIAFHWLAVLNIVLIVTFTVTLIVISVNLALENDITIFFGLPTDQAALFLLPVFIALLTAGMLVGTVQAWRVGYWSTWRRAYYSLLTLAALVCVLLLGIWGMIGIPFVT